MVKAMCFEIEGKFVYWTFNGNRVASHTKLSPRDIQDLEDFF